MYPPNKNIPPTVGAAIAPPAVVVNDYSRQLLVRSAIPCTTAAESCPSSSEPPSPPRECPQALLRLPALLYPQPRAQRPDAFSPSASRPRHLALRVGTRVAAVRVDSLKLDRFQLPPVPALMITLPARIDFHHLLASARGQIKFGPPAGRLTS